MAEDDGTLTSLEQTPVGVAEQHGEGGADDGTESDGANGLVRQLEASDEEDDETKQTHKSPDEDDDDESVTGLWSALQYATYMTGMHFMVREKHRVQSILAAELEKADADFEDAPEEPSVTIDGDINMYSLDQQRKRRSNKKSPGFLRGVDKLWGTADLKLSREQHGQKGASDGVVENSAGGIDKEAFVNLMVKIHYLIICPPVDREFAAKNACDDWAKDNDGCGTMTHDRFVDSLFELVDIWTETTEEVEYAHLAMMIADGITTSADSSAHEGNVAAKPPTQDEAEGVLRLKLDEEIRYNPNITKEPVYMEDLKNADPNEDRDETIGGGNGGRGEGLAGVKSAGNEEHRRRSRHSAGNILGGRRMCRAMCTKRRTGFGSYGNCSSDNASGCEGGDRDGPGLATSTLARSNRTNGRVIGLLSPDRVNATIAKIYLSKMQVDRKLFKRDGHLSWVDKCKRKKDQRMDRFVLQYHIRQFGTKKLARRNLHQLCCSVTRLARHHPRIEVFADLVGVPTIIQKKPYTERLREFKPFACSDFVIPLLDKLCPAEEKLDRWMGRTKPPATVTMTDFLQAVKEVCPHVPTECPPFVGFVLQLGRLAELLEKRCQLGGINKPNANRASIDMDEGILIAMPVWASEEEYLIMQVTLKSIKILKRWMRRSRRRLDARKRGGGDEQPPKPSNHSKVTASPRNRPSSSTKRSVPTRSSLSPSSNTRSKRISASPTSGKRRGGSVSANKAPSVLLESESEPSLPCSDPVPATSAAAAAAAAIATDNTANKGSTEALTGGESSSSSYRARQRLSEAKELDREFGVARENGDGGGGGG